MRRLIDRIAGRGFSWSTSMAMTPFGVRVIIYLDFLPEMFPWEGTNQQPDHTRLNPAFFKLYDGMMETLRDKGIVAHIMLKVYNKMVHWPAPNSVDEERTFDMSWRATRRSRISCGTSPRKRQNERDNQLQHRLIDYVKSIDAYKRLMTVHDDDLYEHDPELSSNVDFRTDQHIPTGRRWWRSTAPRAVVRS